jgi:SH3-like domain-containing protein
MKRLILLAGLILFTLLACGGGQTEPAPTPIATVTNTPLPTFTPTLVPTPTLPQVTVQLKVERANCRSGPGTVFVLVNEIRQGRTLQAVGRNSTSTWWYVRDPGNPGGFCWLSANVTETQGDADALPITQPPVAAVTDLKLRVEPNRILVGCSQFPQTVFFEAQVTTDGPTLLTWRWEVSNGAVSDVGSLIFEAAGTQAINEYYQINAPNEYWVKLYILTPTELVQQVTFPVNCTP